MYDSDSKGISYSAGFFMLIAFAVAGVFIASLISFPIWVGITGRPLEEMKNDMTNPAYSGAAKLVQSITAIFGFLLPTIFTAFLMNRRPIRLLGFSPRIKWSQVGLAILIMTLALFVSGALSWVTDAIPLTDSWKTLFDKWESTYNKQVEAIIRLNSPLDFILGVVVMAFLPALCEETLFRGGLQNFLTRSTRKPWLSIIIVSLIFSAVHFSYYGFLSRFFLGLVLGMIYQYSGRLWLSIIAHFINNALAITLLYIAKAYNIKLEDQVSDTAESYWGLLALPMVIGLMFVFQRISFNPKSKYE